jgi:hypothetical protein
VGRCDERKGRLEWQDDLEMCDLAKVQQIAHWKANVISVNGRYTLVHAHLAVGEARRSVIAGNTKN